MYRPIVAIDVAAEKATEEPRDGIARRKDSVAASQTVRIGDLYRLSTLLKNFGNPPSRLKANIIRLFDVMEKRPQCHMQTITSVIRAMAPESPKMSISIWRTG